MIDALILRYLFSFLGYGKTLGRVLHNTFLLRIQEFPILKPRAASLLINRTNMYDLNSCLSKGIGIDFQTQMVST